MKRFHLAALVSVKRWIPFIIEAEDEGEISAALQDSVDYYDIVAADFFEALSKGYVRPTLEDIDINEEEEL